MSVFLGTYYGPQKRLITWGSFFPFTPVVTNIVSCHWPFLNRQPVFPHSGGTSEEVSVKNRCKHLTCFSHARDYLTLLPLLSHNFFFLNKCLGSFYSKSNLCLKLSSYSCVADKFFEHSLWKMCLFWRDPQFRIESVDDWKKFLEKIWHKSLIGAINSTERLRCLNVDGIC